mmetsp:Transcript_58636/g.136354  ORF Transcript_58636/g.136354 Transcript_58636/m.136354 type:complete len:214 (-) Transcript_58636:115-756(-)
MRENQKPHGRFRSHCFRAPAAMTFGTLPVRTAPPEWFVQMTSEATTAAAERESGSMPLCFITARAMGITSWQRTTCEATVNARSAATKCKRNMRPRQEGRSLQSMTARRSQMHVSVKALLMAMPLKTSQMPSLAMPPHAASQSTVPDTATKVRNAMLVYSMEAPAGRTAQPTTAKTRIAKARPSSRVSVRPITVRVVNDTTNQSKSGKTWRRC